MLGAASVKQLSLSELTDLATVIVRATVSSQSAAWDDEGAAIWTTYALSAHETLKGSFAGDACAHGAGGQVGDRGQAVSGEPTLEVDQEYVLFLWKDESSGRYRFIGKPQAIFTVTRPAGEDAGEPSVQNSFAGVSAIGADGKPIAKPSPISMTLRALSKAIAEQLAPAAEAPEAEAEAEPETGSPKPKPTPTTPEAKPNAAKPADGSAQPESGGASE